MPGRRLGAVLLAALPLLAGCVGAIHPARVPHHLLQGNANNGWEADPSRSDAQPRSESLGLVQRMTLAYRDDGEGGNDGYPATLVLTTLKLFPAPGEGQLRDLVRQRVRENAVANGIRLGDQVTEGARTLADGHTTLFFVFTGAVEQAGPLFTAQDATAKILGEVWNCPAAGTSVAAVGLAQVSAVRRVGGVPVATNEDLTSWRELAGDPNGSVEGQRTSDGLAYQARCAPA